MLENAYAPENPTFSESLDLLEITDPGHADLFNKLYKKIFDNTLFLKLTITDLTILDETFENVFGFLPESDATALSTEDVKNALETEWNGESSTDETALSASDVQNALDTEWNGESSTDETALSKEDVESATK